mmetsp:Transcript_94787/g.300752  ORF Transcript_94787/g.300752 Transcript_94787/m.300752 type:complete len:99 (+) Transcript_94787:119-415(+)
MRRRDATACALRRRPSARPRWRSSSARVCQGQRRSGGRRAVKGAATLCWWGLLAALLWRVYQGQRRRGGRRAVRDAAMLRCRGPSGPVRQRQQCGAGL